MHNCAWRFQCYLSFHNYVLKKYYLLPRWIVLKCQRHNNNNNFYSSNNNNFIPEKNKDYKKYCASPN